MRALSGTILIVVVSVLMFPMMSSASDLHSHGGFCREDCRGNSPWRMAQAATPKSDHGEKGAEIDLSKKPSSGIKGKAVGSDKVWRSEDFSMLGIGMAVGDLDGDGSNEIAIISPSSVNVYRFAQGVMELVAEYSSGSLELKSVDVAKIRKQGPARIYVSAQNRGAPCSFVLELRNRVLEPVIQDLRYFLRVIVYPTKGPVLLGQHKGMNRMYDGPVFRLNDKGNELEEMGRFGIPMKIPIFGFAVGDLEGKLQPLIAVYDKEDHLRVYEPGGKRLYVSKEYYGDSDVVLRWTGPEERKDSDKPVSGDPELVFFRPRIMCLDLEDKGTYDVLTISHGSKTRRYLARTKMLEEGKVCALAWNGDTLVEKWATPPVQGMITDFAIDSLPGLSGKRLIVLERKKTDWFSFMRSKTQLKAYDLNSLMTEGVDNTRK